MKEKKDNWSDLKVLRGTRMENKIQTMDGMYSDSKDFIVLMQVVTFLIDLSFYLKYDQKRVFNNQILID